MPLLHWLPPGFTFFNGPFDIAAMFPHLGHAAART
jgi:hypothetical protein